MTLQEARELSYKCGNDFDGCFGKAYDNWLDEISKKSSAAHIAFTIHKFMREQGWCV